MCSRRADNIRQKRLCLHCITINAAGDFFMERVNTMRSSSIYLLSLSGSIRMDNRSLIQFSEYQSWLAKTMLEAILIVHRSVLTGFVVAVPIDGQMRSGSMHFSAASNNRYVLHAIPVRSPFSSIHCKILHLYAKKCRSNSAVSITVVEKFFQSLHCEWKK